MSKIQRVHIYGTGMAEYFESSLNNALGDREVIALENREQFAEAIPTMEALLALRAPSGHWDAAAELRMIQIPGAGVDSLLPVAGLDERVLICNASGVHEPEMAEFVIASLHALSYRLPDLIEQQRQRVWKMVIPLRPLAGGTLCVVGLGTIGQNIARRASALGMRIVGVRHSGQAVDGVDQVVTPDHRLSVLAGADAVVVVTPLTDATRGLIGTEELAAVAGGAILVNVSRGGVTDTDALTAALESGHLGGAVLDVFETEPLPEDSPLWSVKNLVVTPHNAGWSHDYADRIGHVMARNIEAVENGAAPATLVDRTAGY